MTTNFYEVGSPGQFEASGDRLEGLRTIGGGNTAPTTLIAIDAALSAPSEPVSSEQSLLVVLTAHS